MTDGRGKWHFFLFSFVFFVVVFHFRNDRKNEPTTISSRGALALGQLAVAGISINFCLIDCLMHLTGWPHFEEDFAEKKLANLLNRRRSRRNLPQNVALSSSTDTDRPAPRHQSQTEAAESSMINFLGDLSSAQSNHRLISLNRTTGQLMIGHTATTPIMANRFVSNRIRSQQFDLISKFTSISLAVI